ncbi:MAG: type II toxin-antitoxin system VapC family toxin [Oscillibacter sp.]|nr:type II toxin-antitoxin system VapC family toxin [Oscillibacter sp.]
MKYMLDTNIVIYAKNRRPPGVIERMLQQKPDDLCISAVTLAELEFGASKSSNPARNRMALTLFLTGMRVAPFDAPAAREYGDIRHDLSSRGAVIGGNDMLIAAQARSLGLTLVTNNTREFERIDGLKLENWV